MAVVDRLAALLPEGAAVQVRAMAGLLTQVRLRAGRPVQLCRIDQRDVLTEEAIDGPGLGKILSALMEYSVYARQDELDGGFFTLDDGSRVGVCGRLYQDGSRLRMGEIGSACIRVARELTGCADALMGVVAPAEGLRSALIVSPPGMGKTTLLRDLARQLSASGRSVALADERRELAACHRGVPTLDVGPRTDVMDGGPKAEAIGRMIRSMAPDVIVADEIGGEGEARALADAARCGTAIVASAHGGGIGEVLNRPGLREVLTFGVVERIILLGPTPGAVRGAWRREPGEGESAWKPA